MNSHLAVQTAAPEISFDRFPLWQGVFDRPGNQRFYPFSIGMNELGFICQKSGADVQNKIVEAYGASDYSMPTKPPGASRWANWLGDLYISFIEEHVPSMSGKKVMEIGAGSFYLADHFLRDGGAAEYVIVDPSLKSESEDSRITVIRDYFDDRLAPPGREPDAIISLNCLEHVSDPFGFLIKANSLLKTGDRRLILVFPDIETQFRTGDYNALCFEHLNYFSEASAGRIIRKAGFSVIAFKKELDTLFYVLERSGQPDMSPVMESDDDLLRIAAENYKDGLRTIISVIRDAQQNGRTVAIHGACNGMNTLFALGGLSNDHILLFDGDETKTGKFIPSCDLPILHASSERYKEAGLVIVAAVTFIEQIRSFLESHHGIPPERVLPACAAPDRAQLA